MPVALYEYVDLAFKPGAPSASDNLAKSDTIHDGKGPLGTSNPNFPGIQPFFFDQSFDNHATSTSSTVSNIEDDTTAYFEKTLYTQLNEHTRITITSRDLLREFLISSMFLRYATSGQAAIWPTTPSTNQSLTVELGSIFALPLQIDPATLLNPNPNAATNMETLSIRSFSSVIAKAYIKSILNSRDPASAVASEMTRGLPLVTPVMYAYYAHKKLYKTGCKIMKIKIDNCELSNYTKFLKQAIGYFVINFFKPPPTNQYNIAEINQTVITCDAHPNTLCKLFGDIPTTTNCITPQKIADSASALNNLARTIYRFPCNDIVGGKYTWEFSSNFFSNAYAKMSLQLRQPANVPNVPISRPLALGPTDYDVNNMYNLDLVLKLTPPAPPAPPAPPIQPPALNPLLPALLPIDWNQPFIIPFDNAHNTGPSINYIAGMIDDLFLHNTSQDPNKKITYGNYPTTLPQNNSIELWDLMLNMMRSFTGKDTAKVLIDEKRTGDWEQCNSSFFMAFLFYLLIMCTGDRLCALYSRFLKHRTILSLPTSITLYKFDDEAGAVVDYKFLETLVKNRFRERQAMCAKLRSFSEHFDSTIREGYRIEVGDARVVEPINKVIKLLFQTDKRLYEKIMVRCPQPLAPGQAMPDSIVVELLTKVRNKLVPSMASVPMQPMNEGETTDAYIGRNMGGLDEVIEEYNIELLKYLKQYDEDNEDVKTLFGGGKLPDEAPDSPSPKMTFAGYSSAGKSSANGFIDTAQNYEQRIGRRVKSKTVMFEHLKVMRESLEEMLNHILGCLKILHTTPANWTALMVSAKAYAKDYEDRLIANLVRPTPQGENTDVYYIVCCLRLINYTPPPTKLVRTILDENAEYISICAEALSLLNNLSVPLAGPSAAAAGFPAVGLPGASLSATGSSGYGGGKVKTRGKMKGGVVGYPEPTEYGNVMQQFILMTSRLYSFFASEYKDNSDRDITISEYAVKVRSVMLSGQDYSKKKIVNILFRFVEDVLGSCIESDKMSPVEKHIIGMVIALIENYEFPNDPRGVTPIGLYMPGSDIPPIVMPDSDKETALIALSSFVGFIRPSLPAPIPNGERYTKLNIYGSRLINGMNLNNINNDLGIFQEVFNAFKIAAQPPPPPAPPARLPAPYTVQAFTSAQAFPPTAPPPVAVAAAPQDNNNTEMSEPYAPPPVAVAAAAAPPPPPKYNMKMPSLYAPLAQPFNYTFPKPPSEDSKKNKAPHLIPDYSALDDFTIKHNNDFAIKRRRTDDLHPMEESGGMRINNTRKRKNKHTRKNRQKHRLNKTKTKTKTKTKSKTNRK